MAIICGGVLALLGKVLPQSGVPHLGDFLLILAFVVNGGLLFLGRVRKTP
jgi:SSS family solute:Na+ symporter